MCLSYLTTNITYAAVRGGYLGRSRTVMNFTCVFVTVIAKAASVVVLVTVVVDTGLEVGVEVVPVLFPCFETVTVRVIVVLAFFRVVVTVAVLVKVTIVPSGLGPTIGEEHCVSSMVKFFVCAKIR